MDNMLQCTTRPRARPFIKWAGGKRALIPDSLGLYWEPFMGGGAVFFALEARLGSAHISDVNPELALTYQMVRNRPDELIALLQEHEARHADNDYYYKVRAKGSSRDALEVAARFIYLNKTCYNGLYRVNKSGQFNVPRGRYKKPAIVDTANIRAASEALKMADVTFGDFARVTPGNGDFIYCDPPYDGTFTSYAVGGFDDAEQHRRRDEVIKWHKRGARVMVSNANTPLIQQLYAGSPFTLHPVQAARQINCKSDGRGAVGELLITTYA